MRITEPADVANLFFVAYYIDAPSRLASEMTDAVRAASEESQLCDEGEATAWVCADGSYEVFEAEDY